MLNTVKRLPPAAGMGRIKGTPNKTTALLKDAILKAAEAVGADGKGAQGLVGYCQFLAAEEPKAFSALLGKVLPMQITGDGGAALTIQIVRLADAEQVEDGVNSGVNG